MTAKEKAEELFNKYYSYLKANLMDDKEAIDDAKQCALIAVKELIREENNYNNGSFYPSNYYKEVKQEIEKL